MNIKSILRTSCLTLFGSASWLVVFAFLGGLLTENCSATREEASSKRTLWLKTQIQKYDDSSIYDCGGFWTGRLVKEKANKQRVRALFGKPDSEGLIMDRECWEFTAGECWTYNLCKGTYYTVNFDTVGTVESTRVQEHKDKAKVLRQYGKPDEVHPAEFYGRGGANDRTAEIWIYRKHGVYEFDADGNGCSVGGRPFCE